MIKNRYDQPDTDRTPGQRIRAITKSMDFRSWVVLTLMFLVLTAMMGLNAYSWTTFLPLWVAYLLSGFMEAGALGWKIADERKENSDAQQQLATILVWANVIFGILLLILNLIRSALHQGELGAVASITGWDYGAFTLVALSALTHVAGALLYRQWDTRLQQRRTIAKLHNKAEHDKDLNDGILGDLANRLALVEKVQNKLTELREQYKHLPPRELNALLQEAKNALEEKYSVDADHDGIIGAPPLSLVPEMAMDSRLSPELQKAIADELAAAKNA